MMSVTAKPISTAAKPRYHSRLGIIIAKELDDLFLRTGSGWVSLAAAFLVVPAVLAYVRLNLGGAHLHDPFVEDSAMRNDFPETFVTPGLLLPWLFTGSFSKIEAGVNSVWEPLLITAARRWELVLGRLLAYGVISLAWSLIQAAILASIAHIDFVVALCPFLSYFHPTTVSLSQFVLLMTLGGCSMFAISNGRILLATRLWIRFFVWIVVIVSLIAWKIPYCWPMAGFAPLVNTIFGIHNVFSHLPYDARVGLRPHESNVFWHHPGFWLIAAIGSLVMTALVAAATIRSLQKGELMTNTAK